MKAAKQVGNLNFLPGFEILRCTHQAAEKQRCQQIEQAGADDRQHAQNETDEHQEKVQNDPCQWIPSE